MNNSTLTNDSKIDRLLASTRYERDLAQEGIRKQFWKPELSSVKFHTTELGPNSISAIAQRQWVKALIKETPRKKPLIIISSGPTDNGGLYLAYYIALKLVDIQKELKKSTEKTIKLYTIDAAEGIKYNKEYPYCIIIHNTVGNTKERLQTVRDLLLRFQYAIRIVVPVAERNPYHWCVNRIGRYPTVALKVSDIQIEG